MIIARNCLFHLLTLIICLLTFSGDALADNSTIPGWMFSSRDRLLSQRTACLNLRGDLTSLLTTFDGRLRQIDGLLSGNQPNRQELLDAKARAVEWVNRLEKARDSNDSNLMDIESALRDLESDMTRYASVR